jgi:hypothetical protein
MNVNKAKYPRRHFLKKTLASTFSLLIPETISSLFAEDQAEVRFGLISDLHVDIIHDPEIRLKEFIDEMAVLKANALIQMGDFAIPKQENLKYIQAINQSNPNTLHALGNHDMDGGFSKEEVVQIYGIPYNYYSKTINGIKVLILDGNDIGSPHFTSGYASYIGKKQYKWLENELESSKEPILIVSHQPIAGVSSIDNAEEIQNLLGSYSDKILLAMNGHSHIDQHLVVRGVNYIHINSASYHWVGDQHGHLSLPSHIHDKHPNLKFTCPYSEPLFGHLSIDIRKNKIILEGKKTNWIGPSPMELGYPINSSEEKGKYIRSSISDRSIW